jgi:long-chain acyl-CoA synthetase
MARVDGEVRVALGSRMPEGFLANAQARPEHVALVDGDRRVTYAEFAALVFRAAHALRGLGVDAGGRVALMLPNSVEFFVVTHAAALLGALAVPVNFRWKRDEIAYLLADSGARAFVCDAAFLDEAAPAVAATPALARSRCLVAGAADGWPSFADALGAAPAEPPRAGASEGGFNLVIYTSGTTGRPKGVVHAGYEGRAGFEAQRRLVAMWGWRPDDVHLVVGPAYHTMPSAAAGQHLFVGATVVLMRRFDAEACLRLVATERVTTLVMVPAHFVRLLALPAATRAAYDLAAVRKVLHAAAPCPPEVKRAVMRLFPPGAVWEFYGATEGPGTLIGPDEWLRKPGSVGRAWPGVTVRVLDDAGDDVPPGTVGTVYLSSLGGRRFAYHEADEKTAAAFRGDFFTVGDLGWLDADGYLFLADRRADLIISGGVNIYPAEIEAVLITHPEVADVAVFGIPDAEWGQRVHAVVEPRAGAARDGEALRAWCRTRMADYKCPRSIAFVDRLPRDPNGKLLKRLLRAPYWPDAPAPS